MFKTSLQKARMTLKMRPTFKGLAHQEGKECKLQLPQQLAPVPAVVLLQQLLQQHAFVEIECAQAGARHSRDLQHWHASVTGSQGIDWGANVSTDLSQSCAAECVRVRQVAQNRAAKHAVLCNAVQCMRSFHWTIAA